MKKIRVFLCTLLALSVAFASFSASALEIEASSSAISGCNDDEMNLRFGTDETLVSPEDAYTNAFGGKRIRSYQEDLGLSTDKSATERAIPQTSSYFKVINVGAVTQEKGYYCGPATVIQNLKYMSNGAFNKSQTQVYTGMGNSASSTAGSSSQQMRDYMNAQLSSNSYYGNYSNFSYVGVNTGSTNFTETFLVSAVYTSIRDFNWPPFGAFVLNTNNVNGLSFYWPYTTNGNGHFLSYSGIDISATANDIRFTDSNLLNALPDYHTQMGWYFVNSAACMDAILSFNY